MCLSSEMSVDTTIERLDLFINATNLPKLHTFK